MTVTRSLFHSKPDRFVVSKSLPTTSLLFLLVLLLSCTATSKASVSALSLFPSNVGQRFLSRGGSMSTNVELRSSKTGAIPVGSPNNDTEPFLVSSEVEVPKDTPAFAATTESSLTNTNKAFLLKESLAGTTVALAAIPSSIAFSAIAGVDPLVGVWSSVVLGVAAVLTGMRPGLVAGAAGVVAVPLAAVVKESPALMAPTILLAAGLEMAFAMLKGGRLISLVSDTVMTGFMDALGLLLLRSQFGVFTHAGSLLPTNELLATSGIALMTAGLSVVLPGILGPSWPTAMIAIVASTIASEVFNLPVATLAVGGGDGWTSLLPSFTGLPAPGVWQGAMSIVGPAAFGIAVISILETLLCAKIINEKDDNPPTPGIEDKSVMSMAIGNGLSAIFGGFGGCGVIPLTLLNLQSGGRGVASVVAYSAVMAASVLFFSPLINKLPLASLSGIMIMVALNTMKWTDTVQAVRVGLANRGGGGVWSKERGAMVAMLVTAVTCFQVDMGFGILLGVAIEKAQNLIRARRTRAADAV